MSRGRATERLGRRPRVRARRVPEGMAFASTAPATRSAAARASLRPTPARWRTLARRSPCPIVAASSTTGRSGAWASGATRSPAPMRRPVSAPQASGVIVCARCSSQAVPASGAGVAPVIGRMPGASHKVVAHRAVQVASPRHQVRLPIWVPRSGAQSIPAAASRSRSIGVATAAGPVIRPNGRAAVPPASSSPSTVRKNTVGPMSTLKRRRNPPGAVFRRCGRRFPKVK